MSGSAIDPTTSSAASLLWTNYGTGQEGSYQIDVNDDGILDTVILRPSEPGSDNDVNETGNGHNFNGIGWEFLDAPVEPTEDEEGSIPDLLS